MLRSATLIAGIPDCNLTVYNVNNVMQSDGNSWKIDTFREAINVEQMYSS